MGRRDLRRRIDVPEHEEGRRPVRGTRARRISRRERLFGLGLKRTSAPEAPPVWTGPLGRGVVTVRRDGQVWTVELGATALPGDLRIGSEAEVAGLRRLFQGKDVQIGDVEFDDLVRIDGPEALVRAVCTAAARRLIRRWVAHCGLRLEGRTLHLRLSDHAERRVVKRLRTLRGLLQSLIRGAKHPGLRLLRNAGRDPDAQVRALSLATLLEGPWETLDARRRRRAVRVGASHPSAEVRAAASAPLLGLLADGELRLDDLPERALWVLLADGDGAQRLAAAERLGAIGGVDSVAPLTERAGAFFGGGALKAGARRAIEQIIERTGGLKSGGLSLADDQAGELSLLVDDAEPDLEDG